MSDVTGVSSGSSPNMPPASEAWLSFEHRMLQRRLARCLLRADAALDEGRLEDAAAALDEARELRIDSPDVGPRVDRLAALAAPAKPAPASRNRARPAALAAGLIIIIAAGVAGNRYWQSRTAVPPIGMPTPQLQSAAVPAPPRVRSEPARLRLRIIRETITAPVMTPTIVGAEPRLPVQGPPIAETEPEPQPQPVVMAVNRPETAPTPPPGDPTPRPELRTDPVVPPPAVTAPLDRTNLDPIALPAAHKSEPPPPEPAKVPDESAFVRQVLERYEQAYSRLDAAAASAVWPGVDQGALARAFQGLASQRVSLGDCNVSVTGQAARATCAGTATWEPKVGGGLRTEPRRWSFDLRKAGDAWRIERATARSR